MRALLERARALLSLGLSVIPIPAGSKVPDRTWREYQSRLATDAELVTWFGEDVPMNIGVVTGAVSGVIVIDLDTPAAVYHMVRRLPYTPWQTKTSRGYHLFFAHPGFDVANRGTDLRTTAGPLAVHLRGDGGYVLVAPSVHPSGAVYAEAGQWQAPRARLPRYWPSWLQPVKATPPPAKPATSPPPRFGDTFLLERARRYLAAIPIPIIGHGSDQATLTAAARLVRGFGLTPADAEQLLWDWAGSRDGWTRAWIAEKVANAERYGSEAIGGLR